MPLLELPTGAVLDYEHHNPNSGTLPIVALHGMLGTARFHLGHVIDWLAAQSCEVIAPTLRGYGDSRPKPRDFPSRFYERDAEDVLALLDALEVPQARIIGYSDGGEVALLCAGKQPERFQAALTWGASGYFPAELRAYIETTFAKPQTWMTRDDLLRHQIYRPADFARQWIAAMIEMVDADGDVSLSLAPGITCPVRLILGENDPLNPAHAAQHWASHAPDAQAIIIPETGHAVHDEQTEEFYSLLHEHILKE